MLVKGYIYFTNKNISIQKNRIKEFCDIITSLFYLSNIELCEPVATKIKTKLLLIYLYTNNQSGVI